MAFPRNKAPVPMIRHGLLAALLTLALLTIGIESLTHNCAALVHHEPSHCALCTFSLSAAEASVPLVLIVDLHSAPAPLVPSQIVAGSLIPSTSAPRAPPSR